MGKERAGRLRKGERGGEDQYGGTIMDGKANKPRKEVGEVGGKNVNSEGRTKKNFTLAWTLTWTWT
jgi:hypothetical protein